MIDRPFFSVLVPATRDELVGFSLRTILEQDFADFEIILSHNVAPGASALRDLPKDERIRYVRPDKALLIHDSWEFALSHARGKWILLLGDDDGYLPGTLSLLKDVIVRQSDTKLFIWPWGSYTYSDWTDKRHAGKGALPSFSAGTQRIDTRDFLDLIFAPSQERAHILKRYLPSIMRGAYRKDVVDQIVRDTGRLFHLITPDYGAMTCMLAHCQHYIFLDIPLTILGSSRNSYGSSTIGGSNLKQKFYEDVGNPVFRHTRAQHRVANRPAIFETVMRIRELYPQQLGAAQPNVIRFLHWHKQGLEEAAVGGGDVAEGFAELDRLIAEMPLHDRAEYQSLEARSVAPNATLPARTSVRQILRAPLIDLLVRMMPLTAPLMHRLVRQRGVSFHGERHAINDVHAFCKLAGQIVGAPRKIANLDPETIRL